MKEKRNSRIRLFALLVLVFTLGFGFSFDTSKQSSAVSSQVVQADENNGILTFNGQKQFVMEEKDQLDVPTVLIYSYKIRTSRRISVPVK